MMEAGGKVEDREKMEAKEMLGNEIMMRRPEDGGGQFPGRPRGCRSPTQVRAALRSPSPDPRFHPAALLLTNTSTAVRLCNISHFYWYTAASIGTSRLDWHRCVTVVRYYCWAGLFGSIGIVQANSSP
jgi:hypothetical protein